MAGKHRDAMKEAVEKVEHDLLGTFSLFRRLAKAVDTVLSPEPPPPPAQPQEPKKVVVNARVVRDGSSIEVTTPPMPPRRSGQGR